MSVRRLVLLFATILLLAACIPSPVIAPEGSDRGFGAAITENDAGRSGSPAVDGDYEAVEAFFSGVPFLSELASEEYSEEDFMTPYALSYTVRMPSSQDVIDGFVWCTTTKAILDENWAKIRVSVQLNGQPINANDMDLELYEDEELVCNFLTVLLSNWPPGEHSFIVTATFTAPLNDGFDDYSAGDYREEYTISVEN